MFSALSQFIFGGANLFGSHGAQSSDTSGASSTWKDRKLCFDLRSNDLELDRGEQLIGCFYPIEDVKGNQDELGLMKVTNLRLIWICCKKKRVNLSIGWRTVTLVYEQDLKDAFCSASTSLFVLAKYASTKYEFVFSHKKSGGRDDIWLGVIGSPENWNSIAQLKKFSQDKAAHISHLSPTFLDDPFDVVFKVWQAYKQTHLFRHCRSNLTQLINLPPQSTDSNSPLAFPSSIQPESQWNTTNNMTVATFKLEDLNKLPSEEVIEVISGVSTIESRTIKHPGTLLLTNVRIIWIDNALPLRNLSIPYIRVESIKVKQNDHIVVNAYDYLASSTHVDFLIQKSAIGAQRATKLIAEQMQNLFTLYRSKPRHGPESCEESINFMSHLRPIEHYFDSVDRTLLKTIENFGPQPSSNNVARDMIVQEGNSTIEGQSGESDSDDIDRLESDLDGYKSKLKSYQNEQPLDFDNVVVYSSDLGLAIEKPANGATIESIWRIDI